MIDEENLRGLLAHRIERNAEHAGEFLRRAESAGSAAVGIERAAEVLLCANQLVIAHISPQSPLRPQRKTGYPLFSVVSALSAVKGIV